MTSEIAGHDDFVQAVRDKAQELRKQSKGGSKRWVEIQLWNKPFGNLHFPYKTKQLNATLKGVKAIYFPIIIMKKMFFHNFLINVVCAEI